MNLRRVVGLFFLLSLSAFAQPQAAPKPDDRLKADVLLIVAHPDDETGVSAYLAQMMDQGKRVAAVYLTHGEAGHNNMGSERAAALGASREMELRHALTSIGVQNVWFLGGRDTPSQDVLQSLANWHHGQALEDLVRMIRITRPYVILTWLPGIFMGENHGDHQASGVVATEAFDLAGDLAAFPAQIAQPRHVNETLLEGLEPWQPQKIYYFSDASDDKQFKGKGPSYPVTAISPKRNQPYWRIAMDAFRFHRTQYNSYIEKFDKMSDEQLAKLAGADQDGWASPLQFIFGKSLVPATPTGDVLQGINLGGIAYVKTAVSAPLQHTGLSLTIGGPWIFYENFRRDHALEQIPVADTPEIAIAAGTTLQVPLILRNDTNQATEVSLNTILPDGWAYKDPKDTAQKYVLAPGGVFPVRVDLAAPAQKSDQSAELVFHASSATGIVGVAKLKVRVRSGGLPQ